MANIVANRVGLSVWLESLKHVKQLHRFGHIIYVSKKMKYVVLYCNQMQMNETIEKLHSFHFVKAVEPSFKPFLKTEYEKIYDKQKDVEL